MKTCPHCFKRGVSLRCVACGYDRHTGQAVIAKEKLGELLHSQPVVDIWVGQAHSEDQFEEFMTPIFGDDEVIPSRFCKTQGVDHLDDDALLVEFADESIDPKQLIAEEFALDDYANTMIEALQRQGAFNVVVMHFDAPAAPSHSAPPHSASHYEAGLSLRYVGRFDYLDFAE
uniref:immunity 22 family protein n=1 Tax=Thaumasiovibrio occultus TaxID=1891184 RepID=UPI000B34BC9B|nr:immunity 22 family protein [Thaumasiovibrio occultus]